MIWIILLCVLSGIGDGVKDKLQFHLPASIFPINHRFWDPRVSWKNKYDFRIPFASTIFVWMTDGWHLFKAIEHASLFAAIAVATQVEQHPVIVLIIGAFAQNSSFHITFHYLTMKTFWEQLKSMYNALVSLSAFGTSVTLGIVAFFAAVLLGTFWTPIPVVLILTGVFVLVRKLYFALFAD